MLATDFGSVGPPWWSDQPVFLVGGGPSLIGFDFGRLAGLGHVVGVNQAMFDCDACAGISIDHPFVRRNQAKLCAFAARSQLYLAVGDHRAKAGLPEIASAIYLRNAAVSADGSDVFLGGTSGYAALVLAILKQARKVLLLGFDYGRQGNRDHYHDAYRSSDDAASWCRWAEKFGGLLPLLAARGIEVINASPASRINCFQRCLIEDGLRWARGRD